MTEQDYYENALNALGDQEEEVTSPDTAEGITEPQGASSDQHSADPKEDDRWAKLIQKENKILHKEKTLETDYQQKLALVQTKAELLESIQTAIEQGDVDKALSLTGLSFEQIATHYLNTPDSSTGLDKKLEELRKSQEAQVTELKTQLREKELRGQRNEYFKMIDTALSTDTGDRWELLKTVPNYKEEILLYQSTLYEQENKILPIEEISDILENTLLDQLKATPLSGKAQRHLGLKPSNTPNKSRASRNFGSTLRNTLSTDQSPAEESEFSDEACVARAHKLLQ